MLPAEMKKRNLIDIIHNCLKEHEVVFFDGKNKSEVYLVEYKARSLFADDFINTYGNSLKSFHKELAKKISRNPSSEQTYGVMIDKNLRHIFAFNRLFADKKQVEGQDFSELVYKDPEKVLLDLVERHCGSFRNSSDYGDGLTLKYASRRKPLQASSDSRFKRPSLIGVIKNDFERHKVTLDLKGGPESFYFLETEYETNMFEDFKKTFGSDLDKSELEFAKEKFDGKSKSRYGLFITEDLQIVFAYNKLFGEFFDGEDKVDYFNPKRFLQKQDVEPSPQRDIRGPPCDGWGNVILRYALVGKKK